MDYVKNSLPPIESSTGTSGLDGPLDNTITESENYTCIKSSVIQIFSRLTCPVGQVLCIIYLPKDKMCLPEFCMNQRYKRPITNIRKVSPLTKFATSTTMISDYLENFCHFNVREM